MNNEDILVEDLTPEQAIEKIKELEGKINTLIHDFQVKWSDKVWIHPDYPFMDNKAPVRIRPFILCNDVSGFSPEQAKLLQRLVDSQKDE